MSSEYSYNAPQFYSSDFKDAVALSDDEDDFFDAKESKEKDLDGDSKASKTLENKENVVIECSEEDNLNDSFSKIKIKGKFDGIDLSVDTDRKSHPMLTRQDVTILSPKLSLELRSRSVLKDLLIAQGAQAGKKRKAERSSSQGNSVAKYRSLAEAIYHFQKDTPPRFRGTSKNSMGFVHSHVATSSRPVTVPETPNLLSGTRLRHCADHCLNAEERELKQIEAAKEHFKPLELNKKIFEAPHEIVHEKHFTVPKPFNFTKPPTAKKVEEQKRNEVFVFKANPMPRKIYGSVDNLRVSSNRLPILMEEEESEESSRYSVVSGFKEALPTNCTQIKPFSFDERDKLYAKRKMEKINKIIEDDKKRTEFKAQPLPSYLMDCKASSSSSSHGGDLDEVHFEFKARQANVLRKQPFQVNKSLKSPTKVLDIVLNTEKRAQQRQEFNQQLKDIELERERQLNEICELEEIKAREEVASLRKSLVHKPLPIPRAVRSKPSSEEDLSERDDDENQDLLK